NHVYLSFGAAWMYLPYAWFTLLGQLPNALALEWLSMLIGLFTTTLLAWRLYCITGHAAQAIGGSALISLLPAPLWYMGIGYVTTAIMLPFVVELLYSWYRFSQDANNIKPLPLVWMALYSTALAQIDWLAPFLLAGIGGWALWRARLQRRYLWVTGVAGAAALAGIYLVLQPFALYVGWPQVLGYWKSRFTERSLQTEDQGLWWLVKGVIQNTITGYLPLLLAALATAAGWLKAKTPTPPWLVWAVGAVAVYNGIFLNWTAVHEFALMAMALVLCLWVVLTQPGLTTCQPRWATLAWLATSLAMYFAINLPGPHSIKGQPYAAQMQLAKAIVQHTKPEAVIFTNLVNDKVVEYYARRTFNTATSLHAARQAADSAGLPAAVWIEVQDNFKLGQVVLLKP
ncbi:MAG TPA: hypothetical protein PKD90_11185, partial [Phnomibacter sp.]|nr:hypothetical protein [Phnomibacter sp.]